MSRPPLLAGLAGDPEIEALLGDEAMLAAMLDFERALAGADAEAGLISPAAETAILAGISRFIPDWEALAAGFARDGVVVPELITQLRTLIGTPHDRDLHRGATSQDVIDTALMLQLARIIPILLDRIGALEAALSDLSNRRGAQPLMAHTRMQAALPITVSEKIRTWAEPLTRHRQALLAMRSGLLVIQLGGPTGDRASCSGYGEAIARGLAQRLDLGIATPWHATRDPLIAFGARLALLAGSLGKFGMDVGLLAQSEVGAVRIAGGGSSSAMPHKSNPVAAEVLVALARHAAGLSGTLQQAMIHENERSGAAWTLEWLTLPPLLITTGASLTLSHRLAQQIDFAN